MHGIEHKSTWNNTRLDSLPVCKCNIMHAHIQTPTHKTVPHSTCVLRMQTASQTHTRVTVTIFKTGLSNTTLSFSLTLTQYLDNICHVHTLYSQLYSFAYHQRISLSLSLSLFPFFPKYPLHTHNMYTTLLDHSVTPFKTHRYPSVYLSPSTQYIHSFACSFVLFPSLSPSFTEHPLRSRNIYTKVAAS
jgi:hypothetical protein